MLTPRKIIGFCLLSSPFVLFFIYGSSQAGILNILSVFGGVFLLVLVIVTGTALLED